MQAVDNISIRWSLQISPDSSPTNGAISMRKLCCLINTCIVMTSVGCVQHVPVIFHLVDADTSGPLAHVKVLATTRLNWIDQDVDLSPADWIQAAIFKWTGQDQEASGFTDSNGRVTLNVPFSRDGAVFSYGEHQAEFQNAGRDNNSPRSASELKSQTIEVVLRRRPGIRKHTAAVSNPSTNE